MKNVFSSTLRKLTFCLSVLSLTQAAPAFAKPVNVLLLQFSDTKTFPNLQSRIEKKNLSEVRIDVKFVSDWSLGLPHILSDTQSKEIDFIYINADWSGEDSKRHFTSKSNSTLKQISKLHFVAQFKDRLPKTVLIIPDYAFGAQIQNKLGSGTKILTMGNEGSIFDKQDSLERVLVEMIANRVQGISYEEAYVSIKERMLKYLRERHTDPLLEQVIPHFYPVPSVQLVTAPGAETESDSSSAAAAARSDSSVSDSSTSSTSSLSASSLSASSSPSASGSASSSSSVIIRRAGRGNRLDHQGREVKTVYQNPNDTQYKPAKRTIWEDSPQYKNDPFKALLGKGSQASEVNATHFPSFDNLGSSTGLLELFVIANRNYLSLRLSPSDFAHPLMAQFGLVANRYYPKAMKADLFKSLDSWNGHVGIKVGDEGISAHQMIQKFVTEASDVAHPNYQRLINPRFASELEKVAFAVAGTAQASLEPFISYTANYGIPKIELVGSDQDWQEFLVFMDELSSMFVKALKSPLVHESTEQASSKIDLLDAWKVELMQTVRLIVDSRNDSSGKDAAELWNTFLGYSNSSVVGRINYFYPLRNAKVLYRQHEGRIDSCWHKEKTALYPPYAFYALRSENEGTQPSFEIAFRFPKWFVNNPKKPSVQGIFQPSFEEFLSTGASAPVGIVDPVTNREDDLQKIAAGPYGLILENDPSDSTGETKIISSGWAWSIK